MNFLGKKRNRDSSFNYFRMCRPLIPISKFSPSKSFSLHMQLYLTAHNVRNLMWGLSKDSLRGHLEAFWGKANGKFLRTGFASCRENHLLGFRRIPIRGWAGKTFLLNSIGEVQFIHVFFQSWFRQDESEVRTSCDVNKNEIHCSRVRKCDSVTFFRTIKTHVRREWHVMNNMINGCERDFMAYQEEEEEEID